MQVRLLGYELRLRRIPPPLDPDVLIDFLGPLILDLPGVRDPIKAIGLEREGWDIPPDAA